MNHKNPKVSPLLFEISVIVLRKDGIPQIELRRRTSDNETIKILVESALYNKPVIVLPVFRDRLQSLSSLVESGIMHYDPESSAYYFNI